LCVVALGRGISLLGMLPRDVQQFNGFVLPPLPPPPLVPAKGMIDIFAKYLKRVLSKEFLENKDSDTEQVSILQNNIEQYNNTLHSALGNITPNQAISDPNEREHGMHLITAI
jgi:hypothetical protein